MRSIRNGTIVSVSFSRGPHAQPLCRTGGLKPRRVPCRSPRHPTDLPTSWVTGAWPPLRLLPTVRLLSPSLGIWRSAAFWWTSEPPHCRDSWEILVGRRMRIRSTRHRRPGTRPGRRCGSLSDFQIDRLRAALVRLDVEGHPLTFHQTAHARGFNSRGMDENVLLAAFRRDKTKTLLRIEELDSSNGLHVIVPVTKWCRRSVCLSGANQRDRQIGKNGCLIQARNDYGSGWSTVALHLAERHRVTHIVVGNPHYKRWQDSALDSAVTLRVNDQKKPFSGLTGRAWEIRLVTKVAQPQLEHWRIGAPLRTGTFWAQSSQR